MGGAPVTEPMSAGEELDAARADAAAAHELVEELHRRLIDRRVSEHRVAELEGEVAQLRAELEALRATKLFRYTAWLRSAYAALRRRR